MTKITIGVLSILLLSSLFFNMFLFIKYDSHRKKLYEWKENNELCRMVTLKKAGSTLLVRCKSWGGKGVLLYDKDSKEMGWCLAIDKTGTLKPRKEIIYIEKNTSKNVLESPMNQQVSGMPEQHEE